MTTVRMNAASIGGTLALNYTGNVNIPGDGVITVDTRDAPALLTLGAGYINGVIGRSTYTAPIAATAGRLVASTALAAGTLSIANQPDVPRQGVLRIDPGTSAITAGNVAMAYLANDGTTQTDNVSCVMPGTTVVSTITSKGIMVLNTVVATGIVGGASPLVQMKDNNSLSATVDAGFVDFIVLQEQHGSTNEGQVAVASSAASFTPSTTPNGTINYTLVASYNAPVV